VLPLLLSLGSFAANGAILLSDRAPGFLGRLSARVDAGLSRAAGATGLDVPGRDVGVPRSDFDVHVAIWALAALLVGLATWSWLSLLLANGLVFSASVGLELSQRFLTTSRQVQLQDLFGNALGVVTGTCAVAAFALLWSVTHRFSPGGPRSAGC
jgi:hypothetical protein